MDRKIKYDLKGLNDFTKSISTKHAVRVGIFGNKFSRNQVEHKKNSKGKIRTVVTKQKETVTNAEIGALHEFGSFEKGIPARSWLRMPLLHEKNTIIAEASKDAAALLAKGKVIQFFKDLGIACERAVQKAFASRGFGKWKSNADVTVARKGSDAPLIDSAQFRRAVSSEVV